MGTNKKININKKAIKIGAKIAGRTLMVVGKVAGAVVVTTIEILYDVVINKRKG